MRAWRWPARLVIVAAIVAAFVIDSRVDPDDEEVIEVASVVEPRVVPAADSLTATWYCPTVAISADDLGVGVSAVLRIANTRAEDVPVTITAISPTSLPVSFTTTVAAATVTDVDMRDRIDADRVSVIVESPGGGIAVSRRVESILGTDVAPCAPGAGREWTIAAGDTQRDASERLIVFNPFPDDAVIDVLFATEVEAGAYQAADLRAIVVPGVDVVSIDLGAVVRRRDQVSVNLVARSGRVVVDRVQTFDGSEGRSGMAVGLGAVAAAEVWYQPGVVVDVGTVVNMHVHNPNEVPAEIDIAAESSVLFATGDPVGLTVPARDSIVIPVVATGTRDEGLRLDVDAGVRVGVLVESANGVSVVVDAETEVVPVVIEVPETTTTTTTSTSTTTTTTSTPTTTAAQGDSDPTTTVPTTTTTTTTSTTTTTAPPTTTTSPLPPPPTLRDPRAASGLAHSLLVSQLSTEWLVISETRSDVASLAVLHAPGPDAAEIVASRLDGTLIDTIELEPGSSTSFEIGSGDDAVVFTSSTAIAVGVSAERVGGLGVMSAHAFRLS